MAQMLNIGKKFKDFSYLEIAIQQYQKEENGDLLDFLFHNTTTRYFRTLIIMITSHQGYMSVPVA